MNKLYDEHNMFVDARNIFFPQIRHDVGVALFWAPMTLTIAFTVTPIVTVTIALTMPLLLHLSGFSWLFTPHVTIIMAPTMPLLLLPPGFTWLLLAVHTTCHNNNGTNNATASASSWLHLAALGCSHHMSQ